MKMTTLRLSNFQSFGPEPTSIDLHDLTYVLGPNGSGKTAVLEALSRLFSPVPSQRNVRSTDFHVPLAQNGKPSASNAVLWLEVDLAFPEAAEHERHASVPPNFAHMAIDDAGDVPTTRVRLTAELAADGYVEEKLEYILDADEEGEPTRRADMSRHDRAHVEVHYLPARRDPAEQIAFTAASLIGRTLRSADWSAERESLVGLTKQITASLGANKTVSSLGELLASEWQSLHSGSHFVDPSIAFGYDDLDGVLRQLTLNFAPTHDGDPLPFSRLSDGQKSLLYISLVLSWQALIRKVLAGQEKSVDPDVLRPPVHTVIALEEPENSLAPLYLGRIARQMRDASAHGDVQCLVATHAPTMLRRVDPEAICFLRLNGARESTVRRIVLPEKDADAAKYVREAVHSYPELYFSRMVVLGEGASEQVVLPRVLAAAGIAEDDASVSVVPLGGRHVNHFWRLLNELDIPYVTLLDLDSARYQGGWGRVANAAAQIDAVKPGTDVVTSLGELPVWNADVAFPQFAAEGHEHSALAVLERHGVFFSDPIDLDLMMMVAFPSAYGVDGSGNPEPDEKTLNAVLGKAHQNEGRIAVEVRKLFDEYHRKFDLGSKPVAHIQALSSLSDEELMAGAPEVVSRMMTSVRASLDELPE